MIYTIFIFGLLLYACKILVTSTKKQRLGLIKDLLQALIIVKLFNWAFLQFSVIPTESMKPTIKKGDVVIVYKTCFGPKTPETLLHIPFTQDKIWLTNIPSYLNWIQLPVYKLPGHTKPKRGDCVVIEQPKTAGVPGMPTDVQVPFLKRIIGMPGDRFSIKNGQEYANDKPIKNFATYQYRYIIRTSKRLPQSFFERHNIADYEPLVSGGIEIHTTEANVKKLRNIMGEDSVIRVVRKSSETSNARFAQLAGGNEDHIPEFIIPKKGLEIPMDTRGVALYLDIIKDYEVDKGKEVLIKNRKLWIGGKKINTWRFKQNYYMVMGDNRNLSYDSRFFGLVPEFNITGKPLIIFLSGKNPKYHFIDNLLRFNIRWRRTGKLIK